MAKRQIKQARSHCPINYALEIFGDKWTLLIVRDIVYSGKKTHGEFLKSDEHIATNILADRLKHLECQGITTKTIDPNDKRREIFALTEKGLALIPLLLDLQSWSNLFGPEDINRSALFEAALERDRKKVLAQAVDCVRNGGFLFANADWFPPRQAHSD